MHVDAGRLSQLASPRAGPVYFEITGPVVFVVFVVFVVIARKSHLEISRALARASGTTDSSPTLLIPSRTRTAVMFLFFHIGLKSAQRLLFGDVAKSERIMHARSISDLFPRASRRLLNPTNGLKSACRRSSRPLLTSLWTSAPLS